jgi:hypothetical protein
MLSDRAVYVLGPLHLPPSKMARRPFGDRVRMSYSSEMPVQSEGDGRPVKGKRNRKNLIMSLADSCFEFLRDLEEEYDPTSFAAALRSLPKTSATTVD